MGNTIDKCFELASYRKFVFRYTASTSKVDFEVEDFYNASSEPFCTFEVDAIENGLIPRELGKQASKITLSFGRSDEGPRAAGDITILGLSFALYQIWLFMGIFSAQKTFSGTIWPFQALPLLPENIGFLTYAFLGSSAMALIASALLRRYTSKLLEHRVAHVSAGATSFIGTGMLFAGAGSFLALAIVAGILMGIGASIFIQLMSVAFSKFSFPTTVINTALAVALGFICAVAFINWIPSPFSGAIATLMPLLLSALLLNKRKELGPASGAIQGTETLKAYVARFVGSMALFGVVVGALRIICTDWLLSSSGITIELVQGVACMASVIPFVAAMMSSRRETSWDYLVRYLMPIVVIGIACIFGLPSEFRLISAFFATVGFVCLISLLWIFLSAFTRNLNASPVFVYGLGYGAMQATSIIGCMIANSTPIEYSQMRDFEAVADEISAMLSSEINLAIIALALLCILSLGYALLPRYREMRRILSSMLGKISEFSNAAEQSDAMEEAASDPSNLAGLSLQQASSAAIPDEDLASEVAEGDSEAISSATSVEREDQPVEQIPREMKGSFVRRCEELSVTYKLSNREQEVFRLLAKGYNAAYITDELCISKSTAKTHINHIYRKMDIHTQQELLRMVEDRERLRSIDLEHVFAGGAMGAVVPHTEDDLLNIGRKI